MNCTVEAIRHDGTDRDEIIAFLLDSPGDVLSVETWQKRMNFWWNENPAAIPEVPRGWVLRVENRMVGVLACVPVMYQCEGRPVPTVAASTWRVLERHRSQSLRLFMPLFKLSKEMPVVNTSPSPAVMQVLDRSGFHIRRSCTRYFFVAGKWMSPLASMLAGKGRSFPSLAEGVRVITDPAQIARVAVPVVRQDRLEKRITPEYLRWQLSTPMEELSFAGCVDAGGVLTSYLVMVSCRYKGMEAKLAVDWFTWRDGAEELHALAGAVSRNPSMLRGPVAKLLVTLSFGGDDSWIGAPAVYRRETPVYHYFSMPESLKDVPKRCVMAEGDYLL